MIMVNPEWVRVKLAIGGHSFHHGSLEPVGDDHTSQQIEMEDPTLCSLSEPQELFHQSLSSVWMAIS